MFRALLRFTGDEGASSASAPAPASAPTPAAPPRLGSRGEASDALRCFLAPALSRPDLRDELFAQLVKQTRGNPRPESAERGWRLLAALAAVAPPSPALLPLAVDYLRTVAAAAREESSGPTSSPSRYAAAALSALERTSRAGARRRAPSASSAPAAAAAAAGGEVGGEREGAASASASAAGRCEVSALLSCLAPLRVRVRLLAAVGSPRKEQEQKKEATEPPSVSLRLGPQKEEEQQRQQQQRDALSLSLDLHPAATVLEAVEAAAEALPLDDYRTFSLFVSRPPVPASPAPAENFASAFSSASSATSTVARRRRRASRWKRKQQQLRRLGGGAAAGDDSDSGDQIEVEGASSSSDDDEEGAEIPPSSFDFIDFADSPLDDGAYLADVLADIREEQDEEEEAAAAAAAAAASSSSSLSSSFAGRRRLSSSSSSAPAAPKEKKQGYSSSSSPHRLRRTFYHPHLVFKKRMFREGDETVSEKTFVELSYAQAALDFLSGSYPVPLEEAAKLAALQAGAEGCVGSVGVVGDRGGQETENSEAGGDEEVAAFAAALALGKDRAAAADALDAFVPRSILEARPGVSRRHWRREIAEAARELLFPAAAAASATTSPAAARALFLSRLRALPYGGCLFFPVRRVQDPVGLLPPGRLSLGVNARGLHFFRGGGSASGGGASADENDGGGGGGHHLLRRPTPSSSSAAREYLCSAELRDIMQFGSSASSVFFKMRVAGVLHVFQFETLGRARRDGGGGGGEGDAVCLALQTHINDVMARRFHCDPSSPGNKALAAPPAAAAPAATAPASAAEKEVEELRRKLAAALSAASASASPAPAPAGKEDSAAAAAGLLEEELDRLRLAASEAEQEARLLREEAARTAALVAAQAARSAALERAFAAETLARKRAHNEAADLRGRVRVFARVRPLSEAERARGLGLALGFPDALTLSLEARGGENDCFSCSRRRPSPTYFLCG